MKIILISIFLLVSLTVSSANTTLTYDKFRYEFLHYNSHNYSYNNRIYNSKDFLMSGIFITGVAAMNTLYFSKKVYWVNNSRNSPVYHNSPYSMLAFDVLAVGIQLIYYLRKE